MMFIVSRKRLEECKIRCHSIDSMGDVQRKHYPSLFFFRLRKNFKPLDSFRQGASLEPKKLYLAQFREIAKIKKKIIFLHIGR
jgi:hypothetical protein